MSAGPADAANPYRPPEASIDAPRPHADGTDARAVRLANLEAEAVVRSVGKVLGTIALLGLGGFGLMILDISGVVQLAIRPRQAWDLGVLCLIAAPILGVPGFGLQRLWGWTRRATLLLLTLILLADGARFVVGITLPTERWLGEGAAIIGLFARLYGGSYLAITLARPACGRVCRRDYRAVVRATPEIRCPTTRGALILMNVAAGVAAWSLVALLTDPPADLPVPPPPPPPP